MEKQYTRRDLKKAFNAGKKCMKDHPDNSDYDKSRFNTLIEKLNLKPTK